MAKKQKDRGDRITMAELAIVGAITLRQVQHLTDAALLPDPLDIRALKLVAFTGALVGVGVPLLHACRLAVAISETGFNDGELPTGLKFLVRNLPQGDRLKYSDHPGNDYYLHRMLIESANPDYFSWRGENLSSDVFIELVDRRFAFQRTEGVKDLSFIGWVEGWERGSEIAFRPVPADLTPAQSVWLMEDARVRYDRRVALISINVGLAIRNSLHRLTDHRKKAATSSLPGMIDVAPAREPKRPRAGALNCPPAGLAFGMKAKVASGRSIRAGADPVAPQRARRLPEHTKPRPDAAGCPCSSVESG
ncbi:MAG: hypothetical protein JNK59_08620 [Sterolibacteriaceae bacterium]|nr:hypothetical protein [Sterolibacteriaceae bacterium]